MLKEQLERSVLLGIGLLSITREKAQALADELVKQGDIARDEVKSFTDRLVERGKEERHALRDMVHEEVDMSLKEMRVATGSEVETLQDQVEALEKKVQALQAQLAEEPEAEDVDA